MAVITRIALGLFLLALASCSTDPLQGTEEGAGGRAESGAGGGAGIDGDAGGGGEVGGDGGTGGEGGDESWEPGPTGHLAVSFDFPEAYGEFGFKIGRRSISIETEPVEGCGEGADYVLAVPVGKWDIVAKSVYGFRWTISAEIEEDSCAVLDLLADDSDSHFEAEGHNVAPGVIGPRFPMRYEVNGEYRSEVTRNFVWEDWSEREGAPERPKGRLVELYLERRIFLLPINEDDVFPIKVECRGAYGDYGSATYLEYPGNFFSIAIIGVG